MKRGPMDLDRFWSKVDDSGECWLWTGAHNPDGYGIIHIPGTPPRNQIATRWLWERTNGRALRPDELICHHCDNPRCVRPSHVYLGNKSTNARDAYARGLARGTSKPRETCGAGHAMHGLNLYVSPKGRRNCRSCEHRRYLARRALRAAA